MLPPVRRTAAAALLLAATAGCASTPHQSVQTPPDPSASAVPTGPVALPSGAAGTPKAGLPTQVNDHDPAAVASAAISADWTFDTTLDNSPADAQRRSAPWLTPAYAAQISQAQQLADPGADWTAMAAHHGYTTVHLVQAHDDPTPDTPTSAWREYTIAVTEHGRDAWAGPTSTYVQYAHLTRASASAPWRVDQMRVAQ